MEQQYYQQQQCLPAMLRWAQVCLFIFFLADTYVTQLPELYLGRFLSKELSITGTKMSLSYSIYGLLQLPVLLLALSFHSPSSTKPTSSSTCLCLLLLSLVVAAAIAATTALALWPYSYPLLLLARGVQGVLGASGYAIALPLIAQSVPRRWQMQSIALMTAGKVGGPGALPS